MTLTKFMARSTWVACASELGKLLKCYLKEKANRKLANGRNIEDSEKRKWPRGLSAPALELNTIIFKHVYWYMQLISGERLQDHWSSGFHLRKQLARKHCMIIKSAFLLRCFDDISFQAGRRLATKIVFAFNETPTLCSEIVGTRTYTLTIYSYKPCVHFVGHRHTQNAASHLELFCLHREISSKNEMKNKDHS